MKKITLVFALTFSFIQVNASQISSIPTNNSVQEKAILRKELLSQDIANYMISQEFTILTTPIKINETTWRAYVSKGRTHYLSTIYTTGTSIVGHEDIPI